MVSVDEHCAESIKLSGKPYRELHEWMDEYQREFGMQHRALRHDTSWIPEVREKFGDDAIEHFMNHILLDNETTKERILRLIEREKAKA